MVAQAMEKSRSPVERARLEIVYTPKGYRGFESLLLRHNERIPQSLRLRDFPVFSTVCGDFGLYINVRDYTRNSTSNYTEITQ